MNIQSTSRRLLPILLQMAVVLTALLGWELLVRAFPDTPVPAPSKAIFALCDLANKGILLEDLAQSMRRVFAGFALAALSGTVLGLMLGASAKLRLAAIPLIELLRPIPPIAWIPLSMTLFGLGDGSACCVIFIGAFYPVLTNTMLGVREVPQQYIDAAKSLGCNDAQCFAKVIWPASLPSIFAGLKVGLGFAWMCVVAAEMIAARSGLGYEIQLNRQLLRLDRVVAGMLVIGVVGFLMNDGLARLERFFLPWRSQSKVNSGVDGNGGVLDHGGVMDSGGIMDNGGVMGHGGVDVHGADDEHVVVGENTKLPTVGLSGQIDDGQKKIVGASIKLTGVDFTHNQAKQPALQNLSLEVASGEVLCVLGPSGCGKTTLLRLLAGLQVPSNGEILIDGDPLVSHRNEVTMVFQQAALFPWRTAEGNVRFALESRKLSQKAGKEISLQYLKLFGLENRSEHYPQQLSGGQEQRVALARALAYGPRVLLMDEPFAALDSQTRENLQEELSALLKERAITAVFVTHDIREAVFLADRVVVVSKHGGQILAQHKIESSQPRKESFRYTSEFSEARLKLWNLLKDATNEQIA